MTGSERERTGRLDGDNDLGGRRKRDSMLTRGLAILSAFGTDDVELTLAELARRVDLPKPTAHRLVAELLDSGFLERGRRGLVLGRQLFVLGGRIQLDQKIRVLAQCHLQNLRRTTRTPLVCLSVTRGREVVHLLRVGIPRMADERERVVALGARRVLASAPGPGPVVHLDDSVHACAVLACPVRLPGTDVVLALSAVSTADKAGRDALTKELPRVAQELAARLAALPDFDAERADGVSGAAQRRSLGWKT
ncbi:helix-turn-helix domain-containing protein [Streptomyces sp. NPDC047072]|uniref:helix-turn-helix domain-containing protein n=1 Tax=Streptomyces sp. NPDC047072 TaxID=3154809 RepID=UPI0033CD6838